MGAIDDLQERVIEIGVPHIILGIDPYLDKIPPYYLKRQKDFINAVKNWVEDLLLICRNEVIGVKFQSAFFEFLGVEGIKLCYELIKLAKEKYRYFVILDVKRNDIPDISAIYAQTYLNNNFIDSVTTTPYFGLDSLDVFLRCAEKYNKIIFVVLYSSNAGSLDLQKVKVTEKLEFWEYILGKIYEKYKDEKYLGFVVGATNPVIVRKVQETFTFSWILSPGFGPQGADTAVWKRVYLKPVNYILFSLSRTLTIPDPIGHYTDKKMYLQFVMNQVKEWKNILKTLYEVW